MRPQCGGSLIGGSVMIRTTRTKAAIAAALLCFSPLVARADAAADARFAAMEQRMTQLEDKLATSEKVVAEQAELLKTQATPAVGAGSAPSEIDAFLNTVQIGGYVTASYVYNNNNPDSPIGAQAVNQFDLNHNTFNLDAAKLEIGRAATAPGDAGFQMDLMFGDYGGILGGYGINSSSGNSADNFVHLQEAYVSYNWSDVTFKFGKWETLLGSEVIDTPLNRNVTQGVLFTYGIPLFHTGIQASGKLTEEVGWALAAVNGWGNNPFGGTTETNDNKGVLGQLNFASGAFATALTTYYGSDGGTGFNALNQTVEEFNIDRATVLDWTATVTATDALTFWWNVDWGMQKDVVFGFGPQTGSTRNAQWYGGSLGTQYYFDEKTSVALRGEVLRDSDGYRISGAGDDAMLYTLTGTLGYKLTQNLLARLEVRYDTFSTDGVPDEIFPQGGGIADGDLYGIINVAYLFD
jgi:hypothetical protein